MEEDDTISEVNSSEPERKKISGTRTKGISPRNPDSGRVISPHVPPTTTSRIWTFLRGGRPDLNPVENCFYGTLRSIRAEIENLRDSLRSIKEAGAAGKGDKPENKFRPVWEENQKIIEANIDSVTYKLERIGRDIYPVKPEGAVLYDDTSDSVTDIGNQWERFCIIWNRLGRLKKYDEAEELLERIKDLDHLLCGMTFSINIITIPGRINDHFKTLWPGEKLNFCDNVGDELCKKEDKSRILTYIMNHPRCIDGVVNEEKGVIYKVDPGFWRKAFSFIMIGIIWIVSFAVVFFLPVILHLTGYPFSIAVPNMTIANVSVTSLNFASSPSPDTTISGFFLCACYALVIIGGLAHILIGGIKEVKNAATGSLLAVEGWVRWFHINEQQNWAAAFSLFVGFIFMVVILKTADFVTAFFIGYSIDSVVELFVTRLNTTSSAKITEIKKTVSSESATKTT